MKFIIKVFAQINILLGLALMFSTIIAVGYLAIQSGNTQVAFAADANQENEIILNNEIQNPDEEEIFVDEKKEEPKAIHVPTDSVANYGTRISIPAINLDTQIFESLNSELALEKGVWRMPSFGTPGSDQPTILAGHRWGYDHYSWEYRSQNLFLNIPRLAGGEEIIINWEGKDYTYRVTHIEDNEFVSRVDDLILITCRFYSSPVRVFVYAELVE